MKEKIFCLNCGRGVPLAKKNATERCGHCKRYRGMQKKEE